MKKPLRRLQTALPHRTILNFDLPAAFCGSQLLCEIGHLGIACSLRSPVFSYSQEPIQESISDQRTITRPAEQKMTLYRSASRHRLLTTVIRLRRPRRAGNRVFADLVGGAFYGLDAADPSSALAAGRQSNSGKVGRDSAEVADAKMSIAGYRRIGKRKAGN